MRLTNITLRNFKGFSGTYQLAPMTLFLGPNFAGKSTVLDAVRLLLLGHLPELGKLASATFALASGREMGVAGTFDDGSRIERRWFVKNDSVKTETVLPPAFEGASGQDALFAVMLDASTYFSLSDAERVAYVFANLPGVAESTTTEALLQRLGDKLAINEAIDRKAMAEYLAEIRVHLERLQRTGIGKTALVDAMTEHAKTAASNTKAKAAVMEKTAQGLAFLRTQDGDPTELPKLDAQARTLAAEVETLRQRHATLQAAAESARVQTRRREELVRVLHGSAEREKQLEQARAAAAKAAPAETTTTTTTTAELDRLVLEDRDGAHALKDTNRQIAEVDATLAKLAKEKQEVDLCAVCPYCGAAGAEWRNPRRTQIDSTAAGLQEKRAALVTHQRALEEHAINLSTRIDRLRADVTRARGAESALNAARAEVQRLEAAVALDVERRKQLQEIPSVDANATELAAAAQAMRDKQDALNAADQKRRALSGRANDLTRLAQAEKSRDEARAAEQVAKVAVTVTKELKAELVAEAFKPLLETANAFFGDVLRSRLEYNDGEIGTWRGGLWVSHATFSGTEKAMTYAAIQAALTSMAVFRIMIVDELGRLDDRNAALFIRGVAAGVRHGVVDQFLGAGTGRAELYEQEAQAFEDELTVIAITEKAAPEIPPTRNA